MGGDSYYICNDEKLNQNPWLGESLLGIRVTQYFLQYFGRVLFGILAGNVDSGIGCIIQGQL